MRYSGYIIKRKLEDVLIFPFIMIGRAWGLLRPLPAEFNIYFFFPFYHTGGAEQVHAMVAQAAGNPRCIIFFTRRSRDTRFLEDFKKSGCEIRDISRGTDNKWLYFLNLTWRGRISGYINRQEQKPLVFNGQSNFGYKISPWINPAVKQVELIHSFNTFSWIRLPFLPFISDTVMISRLRIEEHLQQYRRLGVPPAFDKRIHHIPNAVELPATPCNKKPGSVLRCLFVGRGTPEKRPGLFIEMAKQNPAHQFTLAGAMPASVTGSVPPNLSIAGNIDDPAQLHTLYCDHHVLVIPSETEGFPLVLMEAMARGCAVMATPVGDIPYHLDNEKGLLFSSVDANTVLAEAKQWLNEVDMTRLAQMSENARRHASENFGIDRFNLQYKTILQP